MVASSNDSSKAESRFRPSNEFLKFVFENSSREMKKIFIYGFIAALFLPMSSVQAIKVKNSVSSSANSGGNVAESGQIVEGKAVSSVSVQTTVDGKVVEDVYKTDEGDATASVEVTTTSGNSATAAQVDVKVGGVTRSIKEPTDVHASTTVIAGVSATTTIGMRDSIKNTKSVSGSFGFKTIISNVWKKLKYVLSFNWI